MPGLDPWISDPVTEFNGTLDCTKCGESSSIIGATTVGEIVTWATNFEIAHKSCQSR